MKKRLIILGVIIIAILTTTTVFAGNVERLTAHVVQFRIFINGEEQHFTNPVVAIDNRTYVPLREVGEALGLNVEWDGENQKIFMNDPPELNDEWGIILHPFEHDGLWGYKDSLGNIIIQPQFAAAHKFSEGLAFVSREIHCAEFRGYIDLEGNLVIPLPAVRPSNFWDETFIFPAGNFSEGFARVITRFWEPNEGSNAPLGTRGPSMFIDRTGENVFGQVFVTAWDFEDGYARVTLLDGTQTFIDRDGNITGESWS